MPSLYYSGHLSRLAVLLCFIFAFVCLFVCLFLISVNVPHKHYVNVKITNKKTNREFQSTSTQHHYLSLNHGYKGTPYIFLCILAFQCIYLIEI